MPSSMLLLLAKFIRSVTFTHCQLQAAGSAVCQGRIHWSDGYLAFATPRRHSTLLGPLLTLWGWPIYTVSVVPLSSSFWVNFPRGKHQQEVWRMRRVRSLYFLSQLPPCQVGTGWLLPLSKYDSRVILAKQVSFWYRWLLTCFCTFSSRIQRHPLLHKPSAQFVASLH